MTDRGRVRVWVLAAAGLGVAGVGFLGLKTLGPKAPTKAAAASPAVTEASPLPQVSAAIARGEGTALAILKARFEARAKDQAPPPAEMTEAQGSEWIEALMALRTGYARFSPYGRATAVGVAASILHEFDRPVAPPNWPGVLAPAGNVLASGLADAQWEVRVAALDAVKGLWNWTPRRDFLPVEINSLSEWKVAFHLPVTRRLDDRESRSRAAAVACLGELPVLVWAKPAVERIADPDPAVRLQVLISFAQRPTLLTEEAILPLLYDHDAMIPEMAERILKARGLTPDLIGLGKLVAHPRPDMRCTAIPFLKGRSDIDPVVWLVFLSRDPEESVRLKALESLSALDTPEARARVAEMAAHDASPRVRARAGEALPPGESTAALPPLPASPSAGMKIKAN